MGVDIADFDGDGTEDIFLTHLTREKSTLFVNRGEGYFEDRSVETGVAVPSIPFTGFGTAFFDYDNDGWLDIVAANGCAFDRRAEDAAGSYPLQQKKQLVSTTSAMTISGDARRQRSRRFRLLEVGTWASPRAICDNDGGDRICVVSNNNGSLRVILNKVRSAKPWLGLRLLTRKAATHTAPGSRSSVGAHRPLWRRVRADGSYLSANDPRIRRGPG